jgi:hypothetical protein
VEAQTLLEALAREKFAVSTADPVSCADASASLLRIGDRNKPRLLIGGLGSGFTLAAALTIAGTFR